MSDQDASRAAAASLSDAISRGSGEDAAAHYTADAAILPPGAGRMEGHAAIAAYWQAAVDAGMQNVAITPVEVAVTGDTASDLGTVTGTMGEQALSGKYVVLWKHAGGAWKIRRDIWNFDA